MYTIIVKNHIEAFSKYAGIATVCTEWVALLLYYIKMPLYFGGKYPISYFATLPQTRLIFIVCYILAAIFFWVFVRYNLHKRYGAPLKLVILSMIFFIGVAVIPYYPENVFSKFIHDFFVWSSCTLAVISLYLIARNSKDVLIHLVTIITIVLSSILFAAFAVSSKDSHFIFVFEAGSWLVWQLWIIWISCYSYEHKV